MAGPWRIVDGRGGPAGKLTAAARAWALARLGRADGRQPQLPDAALAAEFAALGAPLPEGSVPEGVDDTAFSVLPANWAAVTAFLACETQWRVAVGFGAPPMWLGLDYAGVDVVLRRTGSKADFADLQAMEAAALDVFSEGGP